MNEDEKIVTLARATRARAHVPHTGVAEGAAVRDTDGRSHETVAASEKTMAAVATTTAAARFVNLRRRTSGAISRSMYGRLSRTGCQVRGACFQ